jgi:hypothetical protein
MHLSDYDMHTTAAISPKEAVIQGKVGLHRHIFSA